MLRPVRRWKSSLLIAAALAGLLVATGCSDDPNSASGDGHGNGTVVGPPSGFPTTPDPNLGGMGTPVPPVDETAVRAGQVAAKVTELQGKYPVTIDGDWTPEALSVLEEVLKVYEPRPAVLANLVKIHMIDKKDASLGNERLLGVFQGVDCRKAGVNRSQCWQNPTLENNPHGGSIGVFGNSLDATLGKQMVAVDTIQHEIGHFFSVAVAKDEAWRTAWRNEGIMQYSVSTYGNSGDEEHYAELWSKMYTQAQKPIGDVPWSSAGTRPLPDFVRVGITAKLHQIAQQVVTTAVRAGLLGRR